MTADPQRAGEAWHCVVCGAAHPLCLCVACRRTYAPDGVLPDWLRELRRLAQRATIREKRNLVRVRRGPRTNTRGRGGARYAAGVETVSLDQLLAAGRLDRLERRL
jgi:hypothetical protein